MKRDRGWEWKFGANHQLLSVIPLYSSPWSYSQSPSFPSTLHPGLTLSHCRSPLLFTLVLLSVTAISSTLHPGLTLSHHHSPLLFTLVLLSVTIIPLYSSPWSYSQSPSFSSTLHPGLTLSHHHSPLLFTLVLLSVTVILLYSSPWSYSHSQSPPSPLLFTLILLSPLGLASYLLSTGRETLKEREAIHRTCLRHKSVHLSI